MIFDLVQLGTELRQDSAGIWRAPRARATTLSFPADGHGVCFALEDDSFWFAHRNACILAALERAHVEGPLLDVGGGNGIVSLALERAGIETVLVEPGEEGARNARHRGLRHVICATLAEANLPAASFAAAGLFDVIEHVADDAGLLGDVHRILRPGGVVCVTVPAFAWLWSTEDEVAGHHRRYTLRALRGSLERAGFALQFTSYLFAPLIAPLFALRSIPHRLMRRRTADVAREAAGHHMTSPRSRRIVDVLLAPELARIRAGRAVPFGTSCLAIAVKR